MTLTGEELVKLAAAPDSRKGAMLAALDGGEVVRDVTAGTETIEQIMESLGKSRATVYRVLKAAGVKPRLTYKGRKRYDSDEVTRAFAGRMEKERMERTE